MDSILRLMWFQRGMKSLVGTGLEATHITCGKGSDALSLDPEDTKWQNSNVVDRVVQ